MKFELPLTSAKVLVRRPGARVAETVHALLDAGARVDVLAAPGTTATLDDLASRHLVRLVGATAPGSDGLDARTLDADALDTNALDAYDLVVTDPASDRHEPAADATTPAGTGRVVLVGGGPGDPGLLTLAGFEALQRADVVVADRLAPLGVLDRLDRRPEVIHVGKIPRGEFTPQERINEILVEQARAGRTVVRFKGGDNFVFGRGGEEWNACVAAGIPVDVVPGVSSSIAGPALAGIPVTHRQVTQGFIVVSGHVGPGDPRGSADWGALARSNLTIVVLMGVATLGAIADELLANGLAADTPAACVADAGMPSQRVVRATLATISEAVTASGLKPPAVTVIGRTVDALLPQD